MTGFERAALALPLVGAAALGLPLYVFPRPFGIVAGFAGDEVFIYQLGGAATLGYAVALALCSRRADWLPTRFVLFATYAFSFVAFMAGLVTFASGVANAFVVVTSIWAVISGWALGQIIVARRGIRGREPEIARWTLIVLMLATLSAAVFGLAPQIPRLFAAAMGYRGTDEYIYRLAGAATLGYAVMGIGELRSRSWAEMELPSVMALVFNGLAFVAALLEIAMGRTTLLAVLVALAAGFFTFAILAVLVRRGR